MVNGRLPIPIPGQLPLTSSLNSTSSHPFFLASVLVDARDQVCLIRSRQNPVPFQIRFYETIWILKVEIYVCTQPQSSGDFVSWRARTVEI